MVFNKALIQCILGWVSQKIANLERTMHMPGTMRIKGYQHNP